MHIFIMMAMNCFIFIPKKINRVEYNRKKEKE